MVRVFFILVFRKKLVVIVSIRNGVFGCYFFSREIVFDFFFGCVLEVRC